MTHFPAIKTGSAATEPLQASKWLTAQVLLDTNEMTALLSSLQPYMMYCTSCVCSREEAIISQEKFLAAYDQYISELQRGHLLPESEYRHLFAAAMTRSGDALFAVPVDDERFFIRVAKPVVQLQSHRVGYSPADGKFRSMTYGPESISWGIQFSYPQLYHDPTTCEVHAVKANDMFPNTELFQQLQRWVRNNTSPVPFVVGTQVTNASIRLGKNCFGWINNHPQLVAKGIRVQERK